MYLYDFNQIWETLQNYSKEKNVILNIDVEKSEEIQSISSEYIMCNVKFEIKGEYIDITDFIYSIEDDDSLNFEINDFELKNDSDTLKATFNSKNIPIKSESLK